MDSAKPLGPTVVQNAFLTGKNEIEKEVSNYKKGDQMHIYFLTDGVPSDNYGQSLSEKD